MDAMEDAVNFVLFRDRWVPSASFSTSPSIIYENQPFDANQTGIENGIEYSSLDSISGPSKRRKITVTCPDCGHAFTQNRSLYRHQRTSSRCQPNHWAPESHACSACDKAFARADVRQRHEREHHNIDDRRIADGTGVRILNSSPETAFLESTDLRREPSLIEQPSSHRRLTVVNDTEDLTQQCTFPQPGALTSEFSGQIFDLEVPDETKTIRPQDGDRDLELLNPTAGAGSQMSLTALRTRGRSSLERLGASAGFMSAANIPPCPACRKPFERDKASLLLHIHSHVQQAQQGFICTECNISFQNQANLDYHLLLASRGNCGFIGFEHACSGHHPPIPPDKSSESTAHEHLMLSSFLRHFEQAQIEALIIEIDELGLEESNIDGQRWSWWRERPAPSITRSSSVMPPSFRSEPKYVSGRPRTTIQRIEQKLAGLSAIGPSALIRRRAKENAVLLKQRQLEDSLYAAIEEGDVDRVYASLHEGANANFPISRQFRICFLTREHRYPGKQAVHVHSQRMAPISLATVLGRQEIVRILFYSEAEWQFDPSPLDSIDLTGLAMVFAPPGLAPAVLRKHAEIFQKGRSQKWSRGDLSRIDGETARDLFDFVTTPDSAEVDASELAEQLVSADLSLGLQAMLDLGLDPNETLMDGTTSLLMYALTRHSEESAVVLVAYGACFDLAAIPTLVGIFLQRIDRLEGQGHRREAKWLLNILVAHFPEHCAASACSYLLSQAIEFYAAKTARLVNDTYNQADNSTWPAEPVHGNDQGWQSSTLRRHEQFGRPLSFAAYKGRLEMVKMFLESITSTIEPARTLGYALCNAVTCGHINIVEMLLDAGADPNHLVQGGEPPLLCAARYNQVDIAHILIQRGAEPDLDVACHGTAFICAVRGDHFAMARLLLKAGVNINLNSAQYGTALCAALSRSPESSDYLPMVEFLLSKGASPSVAGPLGNAIDVAVSIRNRCVGVQAAEVDMAINSIKRLQGRRFSALDAE